MPLHFSRFGAHLTRLCLRQNNLTSPLPAEAFQGLTALAELDFYDNRLGSRVHDEEVSGCPNLTTLDLSFNNIRHVPNLPSLTRVETLYLVQNKIGEVKEGEMDWAAGSIKSLELGGNRLRVVEHLEKLVKLEELWLGKNKIRALQVSKSKICRDRDDMIANLLVHSQNLDTFSSLKILSIQSNRIIKMEGLSGLVSLEELYLSHNGLEKLEGLENNVSKGLVIMFRSGSSIIL